MNRPRATAFKTHRRGVYAGVVLLSLGIMALVTVGFLSRLDARQFRSLLLTFLLLALALGLHVRFLVILRHEHRNTARALSTTEHEFQSIFDSALDGFVILDEGGKCVEANPAALEILGRRRERVLGQSVAGLLGENRPDIAMSVNPQGETEVVHPDGRSVFLEYSVKTNYLPRRHFVVLRDVSKRKRAEAALCESDERFVQMADNIAEMFWMIDAKSKQVLYANRAFEAIAGRPLETLASNPISYQELLHPEDRVRVRTQLAEAARTGRFDEEFRIVRADRAIRWVSVRSFPVRDASGEILRLVGTAQDVTGRKSAEEEIARSLRLAQSAWAEADAFRKTTLALTQNLSMDYVLGTLLASLLDLVPCDVAQVLLAETENRLFLARELRAHEPSFDQHKSVLTWNTSDHSALRKVLTTRSVVLVQNTAEQEGWKHFRGHTRFRSWLGAPLIASDKVLGLLSLGDSEAYAFTQEHARLAKSLAIPAAVAIQNARLYERAEIYAAELERRLGDLEKTQKALELAEQRNALAKPAPTQN